MVVFVCGCLNVKIYAEAIKHQDVSQNSPLGNRVVEIELTDPGFEYKYGFWVKRESCGGWTTFTCLNCKKKTHTINRDLKLILVCKDMECGDEALSRLTRSRDYSPVFQIILNSKDLISSMPDPKAQSFEALQAQLSDVQRQIDSFLLNQEISMEERIRRFEEEQREELAQMKIQAQDDKKKMISLILRRSDQTGGSGRASKPRTPLTKCVSLIDEPSRPRVQQMSNPIAIGRVPSPQSISTTDLETDDLFAIDGLESENDLYNNNSSSEDDDDILTASLPVNVPMGVWNNQIRTDSGFDSDSDDERPRLDPQQIASQMQALAESIPDNNRYIFGDRPRPRLNTNNF
ncbi:hypothetical protein C0Q70_04569 [Pomacea canaliculata]|uniref:Uncharacterized protein n=1 Tax=Pomacea canaliculata TaxID=400727 RepID=A0A2T7PIQ8_POMCA|nr:hypothetical protein C0Q70_04569 [Pomacea canaliculata]